MIAIGNDHTGLQLKKEIIDCLHQNGYEVLDFGCNSFERVDYPEYAKKVAQAVLDGRCECGILICGTGVGISIAANKVNGIRAAVCSEPYSAVLSKRHNNTNILALGARVVGSELANMIVLEWLKAEFEGGRHQKRLDLITEMERENNCNK